MGDDEQRVYEVVVEGGVALVPTAAGYGLVAAGPAGVERIYALKGRPASKPCVAVATWPIFDDVARPPPAHVRRWLAETVRWTPLAVVAPVSPQSRLLAALDPFVRAQCTSGDTVAAFHAAGDLVNAVAERGFANGRLIVGSSANTSGTGNRYSVDEVPASVREGVDLIVDHGPVPRAGAARLATTLLDLTTGRFLREGMHFEAIARSWDALNAPRDGGLSVQP